MQSIDKLIEKLPVEYLMVLIPILLLVMIFYILPRIRRDKQGKLYIYSQIYANNKHDKKLEQCMLELKEHIANNKVVTEQQNLALMRLQILMQATPIITKRKLYAQYKLSGGNDFIDAYMEQLDTKKE